jgi:pimeloyl-ACP methyl ester carboxylesterase
MTSILAAILAQDSVEGTWHGAVEPGGVRLRLDLHLTRDKEGSWSATLDSLDQGAKGLKLDDVRFEEGKLSFTLKVAGATFEGRSTYGKIEGILKQAGMDMPLLFTRTPLDEPKRPQVPKKPYPYDEEEVSFENPRAKITLAGTLTLPRSEEPHTAAVLITGSGPQDRDETLMGHKPFLVLADHLTRKGFAVLRFDDRGVGKSTGSGKDATSEDFADDVLAAVEFLSARKEIGRIGLIGHSEGGMIAPMVAVKSEKVKFLVLMAGPGMPGERILLDQTRLIQQAMGVPKETIEKNVETSRRLYEAVKEGKSEEELAKIAGEGAPQVKALLSPWFRFFLTYDPRDTLKKVKCPVLAINGEKDLQVVCEGNLKGIEEALQAGGNERFKIVALPGLNHLFQTCRTGAPAEYSQIEETFAPAALETISGWIR